MNQLQGYVSEIVAACALDTRLDDLTVGEIKAVAYNALVQMGRHAPQCPHIETDEKCWAYGGHLDFDGVKVHRVCLKPRFHDDSHVYDVHPAPTESDYHLPQRDPGVLAAD